MTATWHIASPARSKLKPSSFVDYHLLRAQDYTGSWLLDTVESKTAEAAVFYAPFRALDPERNTEIRS